MAHYVRVVFCAPMPVLAQAFDRIAAFCARHIAPDFAAAAAAAAATTENKLLAVGGISASASSESAGHGSAAPAQLHANSGGAS